MPWIDLDGAANVRDLGGLATQDGGETVAGRLLRGDNLQELSSSDVARLVGDIGLTTVVDLRSTAELVSEGPAPLDAVAAVRHAHHPILPEQGLATDVVADVLLARDRDDQDRTRYPADPLCGHYLGYLEDRPDQVVAALRSTAAADGAALVHCAAGKDRTGVVVALALTAVGVRPQDVVADYAATGERIVGLVERLRRSPIYAADINSKPAEQHRPRPQTMTAFLEQVRARYGGVTRWLAGHGFGRDDLDLLHAKLRCAQRSALCASAQDSHPEGWGPPRGGPAPRARARRHCHGWPAPGFPGTGPLALDQRGLRCKMTTSSVPVPALLLLPEG